MYVHAELSEASKSLDKEMTAEWEGGVEGGFRNGAFD